MMQHFNKLTPAELERLAILSEEMGEAQQIIGKILRHGYQSCNPLTPFGERAYINRWMLEDEIGDVICAVRMMGASHDLNPEHIERRAKDKAERIQKYLHHQPIKQKDSDRCLCGGVGCNSCEPQGRG